jgi:hypothetical protein
MSIKIEIAGLAAEEQANQQRMEQVGGIRHRRTQTTTPTQNNWSGIA